MNTQERIAHAVDLAKTAHGLSLSALAERLSVSRGTIYQWLDGRISNPGLPALMKLAELANVNWRWLHQGRGPISAQVAEKALQISELDLGRVPIVDWDLIRERPETVKENNNQNQSQSVVTAAHGGPNTFAVKVMTDSMTREGDAESIPKGMMLIADPDLEPKHGNIVLVYFKSTNQLTLRKLVIEGHNSYLTALNTNYRVAELGPEVEVLAVGIFVQRQI